MLHIKNNNASAQLVLTLRALKCEKERIRKMGRLMSILYPQPIPLFRQRLLKKSVRDNTERKAGKYPVNFNESSESNIAAISSLRCTVKALWSLSLLVISQTTLRHCRVRFYVFFGQPLSRPDFRRSLGSGFTPYLCQNSCIYLLSPFPPSKRLL